ncbi:hypothetical protein PAAG_00553 [Paracoccidioides lutzii Pb01]|uniref:Uncharacterized protein n=1 Tax=Paracoccidioides lutzii (strain ATCC MYA-826 / Pb01) TaxID=502779 RepID=C1GPV8_PARBA|nr:hypothetical protein PAAG_00553 [Paracoccidioides lutzii Pb01]EEH36230.2 hypothetical protein PAAG_00553 [Paracoccidioides lutzii Pb01]
MSNVISLCKSLTGGLEKADVLLLKLISKNVLYYGIYQPHCNLGYCSPKSSEDDIDRALRSRMASTQYMDNTPIDPFAEGTLMTIAGKIGRTYPCVFIFQ